MAEPTQCVYCRAEPATAPYRPFCSERCKMADLGRWLKGDYAVPAIDSRGIDNPGSDDFGIVDLAIDSESGDKR